MRHPKRAINHKLAILLARVLDGLGILFRFRRDFSVSEASFSELAVSSSLFPSLKADFGSLFRCPLCDMLREPRPVFGSLARFNV